MQDQAIQTHVFDNGLTLIVEPMRDVQSAAFTLLVPGGSNYDPPGKGGAAAVLCDLLMRGAGERDSKQLSEALDNLGLQRHESVGNSHLSFGGATVAGNLPAALRIYADIVLRPHLPEDQFEAALTGVEQMLTALEDEPRQKIIQELRRRCYDAPWGLPSEGTLESILQLNPAIVRDLYDRCFRPDETILGVAGNVRFEEIRDQIGELFSGWQRKPAPAFVTAPGGPNRDHIPHESTQTHIGVAYRSVPYRDPDYYAAWAAVSILSGGSSSRLFTEVREKRGLCYAVSAALNSLRDEACVLCYAGSLNERAQETLDVMLRELQRLGEGVSEDELERCKARAKSSLVMQQESTSARSSSIAKDWLHLGRVTTLAEVREKIDRLTVATVLDYVHRHPAAEFTILTIGPRPLDVSSDTPFHQTTLDNGLQVIAELNKRMHSVAVAFFVRTGSRDETPEVSGVSHFLEHMAFKGNEQYSADDVNRILDELGARYNASTSEEITLYYAAVLPEYLPQIFEMLSCLIHPSLREEDFGVEKKVILEEIGMYDDQPSFLAYEKTMQAHFEGHPLGQSILGSMASVGGLTSKQMRKYHAQQYKAGNIVLAVAGNADWLDVCDLAARYCSDWPKGATRRNTAEARPTGGIRLIHRPASQQQHVMQMASAPPAHSSLRFAAELLAVIVGDESGSRLYWELVDPGFVEMADLGYNEYEGSGTYTTYVSCDPESTEKNLQRVAAIYAAVNRDGVTEEELALAKKKVSSQVVLRSERPMGRLSSLGGNWVYRKEYRSVEDDLRDLDAVTCEGIRTLLDAYPLAQTTTVAVGPLDELHGVKAAAPPSAEQGKPVRSKKLAARKRVAIKRKSIASKQATARKPAKKKTGSPTTPGRKSAKRRSSGA